MNPENYDLHNPIEHTLSTSETHTHISSITLSLSVSFCPKGMGIREGRRNKLCSIKKKERKKKGLGVFGAVFIILQN